MVWLTTSRLPNYLMINMGSPPVAVDPVPDQVAQHHPVDLPFIEVIRGHHMAPILKATYSLGIGVYRIASTIMLDVADNTLLHLVLVTVASIAIADVPNRKHFVDAMLGKLWA